MTCKFSLFIPAATKKKLETFGGHWISPPLPKLTASICIEFSGNKPITHPKTHWELWNLSLVSDFLPDLAISSGHSEVTGNIYAGREKREEHVITYFVPGIAQMKKVSPDVNLCQAIKGFR